MIEKLCIKLKGKHMRNTPTVNCGFRKSEVESEIDMR